MKNSKFIIEKLGKLFEQGIISSKDLSSELFNILKSKRDEIVFKMKLTSKDEFDILSKRVENLENKIKKLEIKKRKKIKPTGFIIGNNNVYLTTDHGRLIVLSVITGKVLSIVKIDNDKITRPFVLNQNMFIVTDNSIIKLN